MKRLPPRLQGFFLLTHLFIVGIFLGVLGPSLPDLQCLFQVQLDTASYLLLSFGIGGVCGQFMVPWLLKRVSSYLLLSSLMGLLCVFFLALTYAGIYIGIILIFIAALTGGCSVNVVLHKTNVLWPGNPRVIHLAFGILAFGSVVSPLILQPFLSDGMITHSYRTQTWNVTESEIQPQPSATDFRYGDNYTKMEHPVDVPYNNASVSPTKGSNTSVKSTDRCSGFVTMMQYPFVIFGLMGLPTIGMFVYFVLKEQSDTESNVYEELTENKPNYNMAEYVYICMMFLFFFQGQGFPTGYSALLSTFGAEGRLNMSLSKMTFMTSLMWFCFLLSRLSTCLFPKWVNQLYILIGSVLCLTVGMVLLCFSLNDEILLWVATIFSGLFSAPAVPAGLAWARHVITVTPVIRTVFLTGVALGFAFPYICGTLVSTYGTDAFPFAFLGFDVFSCLVLVTAAVSARVGGKQ